MSKVLHATVKVARDILGGTFSAWNALVRAFEDYPLLMVGPIIAMVAVVMLASSQH